MRNSVARSTSRQLIQTALLATFLGPATLTADTTVVTEPARLWIAAGDTATLQVRPASPEYELQIPGRTQGLVVDAGTRQVWLRGAEGMALYNAEGSYQMGWHLPAKGPGKSHLTTLPDGSFWIAEETTLEAFGLGGQALHQKLFPGKIQAITLDPHRNTLWVLTTAKLTAVHAVTGEELIQFRPQVRGRLNALAVDPFTGNLWIGHGKGLAHFQPNGRPAVETPAVESSAVETSAENGPPGRT